MELKSAEADSIGREVTYLLIVLNGIEMFENNKASLDVPELLIVLNGIEIIQVIITGNIVHIF